ncbi:MAG: NADH-quinone oxidoreductase subunit A [Firmicutes bacterium]|nr:NADH-quinone oxidoreductase subunit A [Bacillota bacterium]
MQQDYLTLAIYPLVIVGFAVVTLGLWWVIRPKPPKSAVKQAAYECGIPTHGETWVRFRVAYYLYALIFVVFDVETIFLYPWAVALNRLGLFAYVEAIIFIVILLVGLGYAWKEGALEWK